MAKKKRLFPFKMMPGSWGLMGDVYEEAEANYYYDGEELERKLVEIRYKEYPLEKAMRNVDIDFKYNKISAFQRDMKYLEIEGDETPESIAKVKLEHKKISEYEYEKLMAEQITDEIKREIALLKVDNKHGKIKVKDFEKKIATIQNEPWVGILNDEYKAESGVSGFLIELDWNDHFIEMLRMNGYNGVSDEHIVEQWFVDVNKNISEEHVAVIPLARQMMRSRDNGTIY